MGVFSFLVVLEKSCDMDSEDTTYFDGTRAATLLSFAPLCMVYFIDFF